MAMKRTTIVADDALLGELRDIARVEGLSLGEVIRQGLEWRVKTRRRVPSFIGKLPPADVPSDASRDIDEDIADYVRKRHARY
jgi:hypothetical protein